MGKEQVIVALDGLKWPEALAIAKDLSGKVWGFKLHDLFEQEILKGNNIIPILKEFGKVFLDFKICDIPATVGKRVKVYADSGADIITVHASGGVEMIQEAVKFRGGALIAAITALTSLSAEDTELIYGKTPTETVRVLAHIAAEGGVQAIVCSPLELAMLAKDKSLSGLKRITPGIRGPNDPMDDQKRTASADEALAAGADFLVIGRPITLAKNPLKALTDMFKEVATRP